MSKSQITLHLGMSKTGTTFLQKDVFPKLTGLISKNHPRTNLIAGGPYQGMFARAFRRSPFVWDEMGDSLFRELLEGIVPVSVTNNILISDESAGLTMAEYAPYTGSHWEMGRIDSFKLSAHTKHFAMAAKQYGISTVKILIVFRRQDNWMASKYSQRSDRIKKASQKHFEEHIQYTISPSDGYYTDGVVLDYARLHQLLVEVVGESNMLMLPYEWLQNDQTGFLTKVIEFITSGGEDNTTTPESEINFATNQKRNVRSVSNNIWKLRSKYSGEIPEIRLRPGRLFKALGLPIKVPLSVKILRSPGTLTLTDKLRHQILETFEDSNRAIAKSIHMDLGRYGYY